MGTALLAASWLSIGAGLPLEPALTLGYGITAVGAAGLAAGFFVHCNT